MEKKKSVENTEKILLADVEEDATLDHISVFTDLGEHYLGGSLPGIIYDFDVIKTKTGTHVTASSAGYLQTFFECDETQNGNVAVKSDIITGSCTALPTSADENAKNESMTIFGSVGKDAYLVQQSGTSMQNPQKIDLAIPPEAVSLNHYVYVKSSSGYKVAVIYENDQQDGYSIGYFEWNNGQVIQSQNTGLSADTSDVFWVKDSGGNDLLFFCFNGDYYTEDPCADLLKTRKKIRSAVANDDSGKVVYAYNGQYMTLSPDGKISALTIDTESDDTAGIQWYVETGESDLSKIQVVEACGLMQLFAWSESKQILFHCPVDDCENGARNDCIPLDAQVLDYKLDHFGDKLSLALTKGTADVQHLYRYELSEDGTEWSNEEICLDSEQDFQKVSGHLIHCSLRNKANAGISGAAVKIWSAGDVTTHVNGVVLRLTSTQKYIVHADTVGNLEVIMESESIDGVELILRQIDDEGNEFGNFFVISPGEKYKYKISTISSDELMSAKTCEGESVVPDDLEGRQELTETACSTSQNVLQGSFLTDNQTLQNHRVKDEYPDEENARKISVYNQDPTLLLRGSVQTNRIKSCIISFNGSQALYKEVPASEAKAAIEQLHMSVYGANKPLRLPLYEDSIFSKIGSLFKAIAKELVNVAKVVIHAVEEGAQAAIHFLKGEIESVVTFVVDKAKDALHLAESILKKIEVGVEKVIKWIGFMFNWKDILNTAKYLESVYNDSVTKIPAIIEDYRQKMDSQLVNIEDKIQDFFARIRKDTPSEDQAEVTKKPLQDEPINQANAHNIIQNNLTTQQMTLYMSQAELQMELRDDQQEVIQKFLDAIDCFQIDFSGDFSQFLRELKDGKLCLNVVMNDLLDLFEEITDTLIEAVKKGADSLLEATEELLGVVQSVVETKIQIPIITALVKACTGMDLTILNLSMLLLAVPITFAYKLICNSAPCNGVCEMNTLVRVILCVADAAYSVVKGIQNYIYCNTGNAFISISLYTYILFIVLAIFILSAISVDKFVTYGIVPVIGLLSTALNFCMPFVPKDKRRKVTGARLSIAFGIMISELVLIFCKLLDMRNTIAFPGGICDQLSNLVAAVTTDSKEPIRTYCRCICVILSIAECALTLYVIFKDDSNNKEEEANIECIV